MTTALYRRYRPETFAEVIGQEHVTGPLMQALRSGRVNHAYLFSGPRGCGKTTSARILARTLNCHANTPEAPIDTPCGVCPSCVDLARGGPGSLDVVEIDAASHGGVDDARDLRERATFAPARDRYKIFIIDEAHMVSSAGFNALLKIVEEPPPHIKFVFATTEPDKVIGTIRSRTHHYPFRLVPPDVLGPYLEELCASEGVSLGGGVVPLVVRAGGGSVRDSLSVLDQLIAGATGGTVDYDLAVGLLGYTHSSLLDDVVDALAARDGASLFRVVDQLIASGHAPQRFVDDLLERLRDLIVIAVSGDAAGAVLRGQPADQLERMGAQVSRLGIAELSRAADLVNTALTEMTGATSPRLHLELLCARLLLPGSDEGTAGLAARVERLERGGLTAAAVPAPRPDDGGSASSVSGPLRTAGVGGDAAASGSAGGLSGAAAARAALRASRPPVAAVVPETGPGAESMPAGASAPDVAAEVSRAPGAAQGQARADVPAPASPPASSPAAPATSAPTSAPGPDAERPVSQQPSVASPGGASPVIAADAAPAGEGPSSGEAADVPRGGDSPSGDASDVPAAERTPAGGNPDPGGAPDAPVVEGGSTGSAAAGVDGGAAADVTGEVTTEVVRRRWDETLGSIQNPRAMAFLKEHSQVIALEGDVLRLGFASNVVAAARQGRPETISDAVYGTLGVVVRIEIVEAEAGTVARPRDPAPPRQHDEPAEQDEPAPRGPANGPAGSGFDAAAGPVVALPATVTVAAVRPTQPGSPAVVSAPAAAPPAAPPAGPLPVEPEPQPEDREPASSAESSFDDADAAWLAGVPLEPSYPEYEPEPPLDDPGVDGAPSRGAGPWAEDGVTTATPVATVTVPEPAAAPGAPAVPPGATAASAVAAAAVSTPVLRGRVAETPAEAAQRRVLQARSAPPQGYGAPPPSSGPDPYDDSSAHDPDIVTTGLVGVPLVIKTLNGTILDEQVDQG